MYRGYRVKINGIEVSNNFISQGSYSYKKGRRVLDSYYDATSTLHEELSRRETAEISFELRERSMAEQEQLVGIFAKWDNVEVEYWDDVLLMYKTGFFKMSSTGFKHRNTNTGGINYAKTAIALKEY